MTRNTMGIIKGVGGGLAARDGRRFYWRADDEEFQTDEEESRQGNACCRRSV